MPLTMILTHVVAPTLGAAALLLFGKKRGEDKPNPTPKVDPVGPPRKTRPTPFPDGAGEAVVIAPEGVLIHREPRVAAPMVAPPGVSPNDAFSGTTVAVFSDSVAGEGGTWWLIMTPGGGVGYARAIDLHTQEIADATNGEGIQNFRLVKPVPSPHANPAISGMAGIAGGTAVGCDPNANRPFGLAYGDGGGSPAAIGAKLGKRPQYTPYARPARPFMPLIPASWHPRVSGDGGLMTPPRPIAIGATVQCAGPAGCWLRPAPDAPGGMLVPHGASVYVDEFRSGPKREVTSPGAGGWARVRTNGPRGTVSGWLLAEWLR